MREEGMEETKSPACEEFEPRLMLFAAGELDASEIADVNEHLHALLRMQSGTVAR